MIRKDVPTKSTIRYYYGINLYSMDEIAGILKKEKLRVEEYKYLFVIPSVPLPSLVDKYLFFLIKGIDIVFYNLLPKKIFSRNLILLISNEK